MVKKISILFILEPLLYSQEFMHLADISRKLKMPHTTLRKYLNNFEKIGVVIKQIKGRLTMYKLNYSNPLITDYLQVIEKEKLLRKCNESTLLKEIVLFIHENENENNILIFGSAVEDIKKANDIDLLITGKNNMGDKIKLLEKKLNLEFHIIKVKKLEEINKALKNEIINKHIIVEGIGQIVKWMLKN